MIRPLAILVVAFSNLFFLGEALGGNLPVGITNVLRLEVPADISTLLSNVPNHTLVKLGPGRFPVVPSKVGSNGLGAINIFNKTNIIVEGVPGSSIIDGTSALGELLYVTNCSQMTFRGLTLVGLVVTNYTLVSAIGHVWASFSLYAVDNVTIEQSRLIDGHDHGIHDMGAQPNWNTISTNNIVVRSNYFDNFGSARTNEAVQTDGTAVVPTGWLVEDNEFVNCLRCVEPYSESDRTANLFFNCVIRGNRMINTLEAAVLTAGSTNGHGILVEGNYIYNEPGYTRRGTNVFGSETGIWLNAGQRHVVRSNIIVNASYAGVLIGGGALAIADVVIEGNHIENVDANWQGVGIGTYAANGPDISNLVIRNNWIKRAQNHAMLLLSVRDGVVQSNTIVDPTVLHGPAIKLWTNGQSFCTNVLISGNYVSDTTGKMTYGIEVTQGNRSIRVEDNCIQGALLGPVLCTAGAEMIFASRGNGCPATVVPMRINEWMAANTGFILDPADGKPDGWFELFNEADFSVDLGGYYLTDDRTKPFRFQIPRNGRYVIPPRGFLMAWADEEESQNGPGVSGLHVDFRLNAAGEEIGLFAGDGTEIDSVTFGNQTSDVAEGVNPDNIAQQITMVAPTPGFMNLSPDVPTIRLLSFSNGVATLRFSSRRDRLYRLEHNYRPDNDIWTTLIDGLVAVDDHTIVTDSTGTNGQRFYRAVLLPLSP